MAVTFAKLAGLALAVALAACGGGGGGSSVSLTDSGGTNTGGVSPGSNTGAEPTPGGPVASDQGVEFRVNTTTALSQNTPDAARLPDGGYVVAWTTRSSPPQAAKSIPSVSMRTVRQPAFRRSPPTGAFQASRH